MLDKAMRVTGREFEQVIKEGRVFHSPFFILRTSTTNSPSRARVAAVAPVKIAKTAVMRHKVRRRIYEAVRILKTELKPGSISIIFAKQPVLKAEFAHIKNNIKEIFVKAGLLR